mmetsp:Transcript_3513/g.5355  ORF Transcript_3513/g.5355 Transcript_3513/m.5355 type:complete len:431 (+) Transcript_3513:139-1431(+)
MRSREATRRSSKSINRRRGEQKNNGLANIFLLTCIGAVLIFFFNCSFIINETGVKSQLSVLKRTSESTSSSSRSTYTNSTSILAWDFNGHDIVHVIQTRFMQSQSNLIVLGEARKKLFETITLPSIVAQTSKRFLWIIRTDPNLNPTLRKSLVELLVPYPNFLLVGSNSNPEGFRHAYAVKDITNSSLFSGSLEVLQRFHDVSQSRILIESRLDADDGLHFRFVDFIQTMARKELQSQQKSWMIFCAHHHLEWHHTNPYKKGMMKDSSYGYVVATKQDSCITAGLSFVYGLGAERRDLPSGGHHILHRAVPICNSTRHLSCIHSTTQLQPGALRGRTPTSAGMLNVVTGDYGNIQLSHHMKDIDFQDQIWKGLRKVFGVKKGELAVLQQYLKQNVVEIAQDNLEGQCTKGHSCKNSSKSSLQAIVTGKMS